MVNYITIDGGTTNTRISLICDGKILDTTKIHIGIINSIDDKDILNTNIKNAIDNILIKNSLGTNDIKCIIGCGMITSEHGLCHLEHIAAPCGIDSLSKGLYTTVIDSISNLPFVFVRGVKKMGDFEITDMMRGEETEIFGLSDKLEMDCLYVLPGSHSKLIYINALGEISDFSTELTGELISAIANNTILKDMIDLSQTEIDDEFLQKGYIYTKNHGINSALFKTRTLKMFFGGNEKQLFSFFLGSVLTSEIENIINSTAKRIVIGGKAQLKNPMATLIKLNSDKIVLPISDEISNCATAYGCVKIYENSLGIKLNF